MTISSPCGHVDHTTHGNQAESCICTLLFYLIVHCVSLKKLRCVHAIKFRNVRTFSGRLDPSMYMYKGRMAGCTYIYGQDGQIYPYNTINVHVHVQCHV